MERASATVAFSTFHALMCRGSEGQFQLGSRSAALLPSIEPAFAVSWHKRDQSRSGRSEPVSPAGADLMAVIEHKPRGLCSKTAYVSSCLMVWVAR